MSAPRFIFIRVQACRAGCGPSVRDKSWMTVGVAYVSVGEREKGEREGVGRERVGEGKERGGRGRVQI
jgi:hypothetical protein